MTRSVRLYLGLFILVLVTGCGTRAFEPQDVFLHPTLNVVGSGLGEGGPVSVTVVDERDQHIIGYRGWAYGNVAAISTSRDIAQVVGDEIRRGLIRHGFKPVAAEDGPDTSLKVEVRRLNYNVTQAFQFSPHTEATLKAVAGKGGDAFERRYRVRNEKR